MGFSCVNFPLNQSSQTRADAYSMFLDPPGVPEHPLFRDVDLSHLKLGRWIYSTPEKDGKIGHLEIKGEHIIYIHTILETLFRFFGCYIL